MTHSEKLAAVRSLMKEQGIDAYIIPAADPHISEYLPEHYKCIAWMSGFTGSAGTLAITQDFAGLWTDSRYFVQAKDQLADTGFELVKLKVQTAPEYADWIAQSLVAGSVVAFDGNLASVLLAQAVEAKLQPLDIQVLGDIDLLTPLWEGRPALPKEKAYLLADGITGQSAVDKIKRLRERMGQRRVAAHLISSLDDIAWLFNLRGSDVACNPVVLGFALITQQEATLYVDLDKLTQEDKLTLANAGVALADYQQVPLSLGNLSAASILIDPKRTCFAIYRLIPQTVDIVMDINPTTHLKAIKNEMEITHTRKTMVKDGVALTRFFKWLEETVGTEPITEISVAEKLRELRAAQVGFVGESFDTIAGYQAHGALPHYKATAESDSVLQAEGLLLVDSGGQYLTGTTDITRVVSLGNATAAQKEDYTLVLKGTIEGSTAIFPQGTRGYQIDAMTRKPLWDELRNFGHGTGHGVGFFLNVHEGPHTFNPANIDVAVEAGMVTSIEPGLYRDGEYGIRIENLVLSNRYQGNQFGEFMAFETLTLCYIDTSLIEKSLLGQKHVDWLNRYHALVYERLSPHLDEHEREWLKGKTKAI